MNRMIVVLGAAVVVLGGFSVYALMQGAHFGPRQTTPAERALDQVREQMGPQAEVRHVESGRGRAACGYAGLKGSREAVAFVSRPNRILMSNDPLTGEFATLKSRYCPGFDAPAPAAASGKS
ncbi:hypothetical protein JIX58_01470 [Brevundimonas diminuta]|jgi:hypothetical protein|nr:hypothetical protein LTR94_029569 [Friedmanniomyces endolithicus]MBK1969108.1 hypothetical protein [Brevundimonas diminuta]MBK1974413.1 hypothetical protein [Brevundimonas diminuta]HBY43535.1 hypothetical protein [Brevundimonas sp.]